MIDRGWGRRALMGALLALGLSAGAPDQAQAREVKDILLKGDAVCTRCHDQSEAFPVLAIGKNKHGTAADGRLPSCVGCHGESETHINKPEDAKERPKPTINFSSVSKGATAGRKPGNASPIEEQNGMCLNCHQGGKFIHYQNTAHGTSNTACTSCHQLHTQHDKVRDRLAQPDVCYTCHKEKRAEVNKPFRHPTKEGKVVCQDCHSLHGSAGPKLMARDSVTNTCYTCHMEKRGPFVWTHQPVTEDCAICHNPHGSNVQNLLKVRPPFLCQQCHEPATHQGSIPALTGGGSGSNANGIGTVLARGCLNCHTQIHGTNNPADHTRDRALFR